MIQLAGLSNKELKSVLKIMGMAEKEADTKTLQWCARMIAWLYDKVELIDFDYMDTRLFKSAWQTLLKSDPMPQKGKA
jgi:hypothetical protein